MNNSKAAITVSKIVSVIQMVVGVFFSIGFISSMLAYLLDKEFQVKNDASFLIIFLLYGVLGGWLIVLSRKRARLIREFKKYIAVIAYTPSGYIPALAATLGVPENTVRNNLELMIKKKLFSNAYIDKNFNCLVVLNRQPSQCLVSVNTPANPVYPPASRIEKPIQSPLPVNGPVNFAYASAPVPEMITVKCSGCGGINAVIKGQTGECDYCGSTIKGE